MKNYLSYKQQANAVAFFDAFGSLDGSVSLFIGLYQSVILLRDHADWSKEDIPVNEFYRWFCLAVCALISIQDAVAHRDIYSKDRFSQQHQETEGRGDAEQGFEQNDSVNPVHEDSASTLEQPLINTRSTSTTAWIQSFNWKAIGCTVACTLEVITVPFAVSALLADNEIRLSNRQIQTWIVLAATVVSSLLNIWNADTIFNQTQGGLSEDHGEHEKGRHISHATIKRVSKAFFITIGHIAENINFLLKIFETFPTLYQSREIDSSQLCKLMVSVVCVIIGLCELAVKNSTLSYYNHSDDQKTPLTSDKKSRITDMANTHVAKETNCSDKCCHTHTPFNRSSTYCLPSDQSIATTEESDNVPDAVNLDGEKSWQDNLLVTIATSSDCLSRTSVPFSCITLGHSAGFFEDSVSLLQAGLYLSLFALIINCVSSPVVYNYNLFHMSHKNEGHCCDHSHCSNTHS